VVPCPASETPAQHLHPQLPALQVDFIDIVISILPGRKFEASRDVDHAIVIK